ncbi:GGDEF domain-containing protein [Coprococcus sp. HCN-4056]
MTMTINVAVFLALILEIVILYVVNLQDYKRTSQMLMNQTMEVIEKNDSREKEMLESLKEDYKVRVNAVAYILDAKPEVENDLNELKKIAAFMSVDEIHLFDENGVIYGGTIPKYYGYSFDSGEQMAYFTPMLQDKDLTMCQDVMPNTSEGRSMMYAITWNNAGTKMIQVGIEPKRLIDEMNQNQISAVISNMPMYTGINIFVADSGDGKILGSTKAAMVGKTLNDVGISRDKVTEQADVPAICYRNIDGIVSRCAFDRTDDYIVVVTCNLLSNIKTDVIIMVIMIVYFIIAAKALASMFTKLDRVRRSAYTDELTGCFNRKAYQENVEEYWKSPDMVYISMDVNGLKKVNDHQGHAAGDELLQGAVECMMKSFNGYGRVYRFGGDEFAAIVFADSRRLKKIIDDFKERMNKWSGKKVSDVSVSLGYAEKCERQWENFEELAEQADERMYACKAEYYSKKGEDRRKLQAAHNALTKLYTKVLIINLTQNSYQIVSIDRESLKNSVFSAKLSDWFATFANSDELYPDDRQAFLQKTSLQNLKKNINGTGKSYSIIYRRKYGEEYKDTMMEILAAEDYTDDSQVCYLCVRCLG